jgi:hypothetical protein
MGALLSIVVNMDISSEEAEKAAMKALKAQAMVLKGRSQQLCPVDSGTLRNSCVIEEGDGYITVGYGGAATPYAAIQHENMSFHHPVGQAKYLEQPASEMEEEIKAAVEAAVKAVFK